MPGPVTKYPVSHTCKESGWLGAHQSHRLPLQSKFKLRPWTQGLWILSDSHGLSSLLKLAPSLLHKTIVLCSEIIIQSWKWSYDPRSYERNFSNCVEKHEKFQDLTGFEPALTNWATKTLMLGAGHLWVPMFPWGNESLNKMINEMNHILNFGCEIE